RADVPQAIALNGTVRQIESSEGSDARKPLQPFIGHLVVASALALEGVVAVVEVDGGGDIENLSSGVAGGQIQPLRTARGANELAAEFLDLGFQRQSAAPHLDRSFNLRQKG